MAIRIDPRVDYAFKLMLGNPAHPDVTIHFLNSILRLKFPIESVAFLNPLLAKERSADKLVVLDILARDSTGRLFNIEMQTRIPLSFPNRLLFYNCKNFSRQLGEGDGWGELRPAISICLVDRIMFPHATDMGRWHHSFRLRCDQDNGMVLTNDFEFHVLELPKFCPSNDTVGSMSPVEKWLFLFTHAGEMELGELADLLVDPPYREAIGVLQMISNSPEDLEYYEARLKFLRDEEGKLEAAKIEGREEGEKLGIEKGEKLGIEKGELIGKVRMLQELLGDVPMTVAELSAQELAALSAVLDRLQHRLRSRQA